MAITVDNLQIEIQSNANNASNSIKSLSSALERLKAICNGGIGLGAVAEEVKALSRTSELKASNTVKNVTKAVKSGVRSVQDEIRKADSSGSTFGGVKDSLDDVKKSAEEAGMAIADVQDIVGLIGKGKISTTRGSSIVGDVMTGYEALSDDIQGIMNKVIHDEITMNEPRQITEYAREYSELQGIMDKINEGTLEWGNSLENTKKSIDRTTKSLDRTKKAIDDNAKSIKKFGDATKGATSKLGQFFNSLKRIAMYRAIRSAMKAITSGISEGVKNLIQYSALIYDTDSVMAHSTTSEYATQFLYLKNSIASAVAPLIQALLPTIKQVTAWFINGANAVNQFISALQGKSTYTKAKEYAQDTAEELDNAVGSAKELKKQLQGFDELNNLSFKDESSGASSITPNYGEMFEEAPITKIAKEWADSLEPILGLAKDIGLAFLAWEVGSVFINSLSNVSTLLGGIAKGALLITIGFELAKAGGERLGSAEDAKDYIIGAVESLAGVIATGIGGYIVGATLGIPIIGVSLGVLIGISGVIEGINEANYQKLVDQYESSDWYKDFSELKSKIDKDVEEFEQIKINLSNITGEISAKDLAKIRQAKDLVEKIYSIDTGNRTLTSDEINKVKKYIEQLNGLGLKGVELSFDELTGHVSKTKAEVTACIEEVQKQFKITALSTALTDTYTQLINAEMSLETLESDRTALMTKLNEAMRESSNIQRTINARKAKFVQEMVNEHGALAENAEQYWNNSAEAKKLNDTLTISKMKVSAVSDELDIVNSAIADNNSVTKEANKKIKNFTVRYEELTGITPKVKDALNGVASAVLRTTNNLKDLLAEWKEYNGINIAPKDIAVNIQTTINGAQASGLARTEVLKGQDLNGNGIIGARNGGTIPKSHLFYANENGNPEYIGNMGGTTAVANSGQMAEAIEQASYRGMARALQENGGADGYEVIWDSQKVFGVMRKEASNYTKRTGNVAFS